MSAPKAPRKRPYHRHGLYLLQGALSSVERERGSGWLDDLGDTGRALREWRTAIVADLGGENSISAQERVVIDAATTTYLLLSSVDRFLLEQSSIVNKSKRKLFPVVLERQRLADALVRYLEALGLRRRVSEAQDLGRYLADRYGANGNDRETCSPRGETQSPESPQSPADEVEGWAGAEAREEAQDRDRLDPSSKLSEPAREQSEESHRPDGGEP